MHALAPRPRTAGPQAGQPAADGKLVPGGARVELRVPLLPPPGGRSPLSGPSRGARSCRLRDIGRPVERGRDGGPAGQRRRRHSARSVCPCRGIRRFRFVPCAGRAGAAGPAWRPLAQARAALDANHAGLDAAKAESARPRWRSARPMRWGAGSSSWPAAGCTTRRTCAATTGPGGTRSPARSCARGDGWAATTRCSCSTRSTSSAPRRPRSCSRCSTRRRTTASATNSSSCRSTSPRCCSSRQRTRWRGSRQRCVTGSRSSTFPATPRPRRSPSPRRT